MERPVHAAPAEAWVAERLERWRSAGDRAALGDLLKWQRHHAYTAALRVLGRTDDAEDAVQQAYLKLLTRTHGFENAQAFRLAVFRAVMQCALNRAQANRRRRNAEQAMEPRSLAVEESPAQAAEKAETLRALCGEMERLEPEERAAIALCCQQGLSLADAAEALETPRETLRDRLGRTLARLRERLGQRHLGLSLLLLTGLLAEERAEAAPASLDHWLDQHCPGTACARVPECSSGPVSAAQVLAEIGLLERKFPWRPQLAGAALLAVAAGLTLARLGPERAPEGTSGVRKTAIPIHAGVDAGGGTAAKIIAATDKVEPLEEGADVKKLSVVSATVAAAVLGGVALGADKGATAGPAERREVSKEEYKRALEALASKKAQQSEAPKPAAVINEFNRERD